jgi:hypothetical protein
MGYVHFCIGHNGLSCAYAHWMQSIVGIMVSRITKCRCWPRPHLCQEKLSPSPKIPPRCCTNDTLSKLQQTVTIRDQGTCDSGLTSVGPLFSGAGNRANQVSTHESKTKNYFCSTSRLVAAAYLTLPQRIKPRQQQQLSRKLGHNRSNCNTL